jgi:hypothetical protein
VRYFYPAAQTALPDLSFFPRAAAELSKEFPGFEFVTGCGDDRNWEQQEKEPLALPEGVRNIGKQTKEKFEEKVAKSKAMLGIGWPNISPSPHIALSYVNFP